MQRRAGQERHGHWNFVGCKSFQKISEPVGLIEAAPRLSNRIRDVNELLESHRAVRVRRKTRGSPATSATSTSDEMCICRPSSRYSVMLENGPATPTRRSVVRF